MRGRQIQRKFEVGRLGGQPRLELPERIACDLVLLLGLGSLAEVLIDRRDGESGADFEPGLLHQRVDQLERLVVLFQPQIDRGQLERHPGVVGIGRVPLLQPDELLLDLLDLRIAQAQPLFGGRRLAIERAVELKNAPFQVKKQRAIGVELLVGRNELDGVVAPGRRRCLVARPEFIIPEREQQLGEVRQYFWTVRAKRPSLFEGKYEFARHPVLLLFHLVTLGRVGLLRDGELVVVDAPAIDISD